MTLEELRASRALMEKVGLWSTASCQDSCVYCDSGVLRPCDTNCISGKLEEALNLAETMLMLTEMTPQKASGLTLLVVADGSDWPYRVIYGGVVESHQRKSLHGAVREAHAKWKDRR